MGVISHLMHWSLQRVVSAISNPWASVAASLFAAGGGRSLRYQPLQPGTGSGHDGTLLPLVIGAVSGSDGHGTAYPSDLVAIRTAAVRDPYDTITSADRVSGFFTYDLPASGASAYSSHTTLVYGWRSPVYVVPRLPPGGYTTRHTPYASHWLEHWRRIPPAGGSAADGQAWESYAWWPTPIDVTLTGVLGNGTLTPGRWDRDASELDLARPALRVGRYYDHVIGGPADFLAEPATQPLTAADGCLAPDSSGDTRDTASPGWRSVRVRVGCLETSPASYHYDGASWSLNSAGSATPSISAGAVTVELYHDGGAGVVPATLYATVSNALPARVGYYGEAMGEAYVAPTLAELQAALAAVWDASGPTGDSDIYEVYLDAQTVSPPTPPLGTRYRWRAELAAGSVDPAVPDLTLLQLGELIIVDYVPRVDIPLPYSVGGAGSLGSVGGIVAGVITGY